jgi:hypothetical protein
MSANVVKSNSGGEVAVFGDIVQLKVLDGDCEESEFHELLQCLLSIFSETRVPLKLILNAEDEEVSSDHISAITDFLQDTTLDTRHLKGTALVLSAVQATVASILVGALDFSRPVKVFSDDKNASDFIAAL